MTFHPGEETVHITQTAEGLGPDNYLSLKTHIQGQVPFLPENVTVHITPYKELYHYSSSGKSPFSAPGVRFLAPHRGSQHPRDIDAEAASPPSPVGEIFSPSGSRDILRSAGLRPGGGDRQPDLVLPPAPEHHLRRLPVRPPARPAAAERGTCLRPLRRPGTRPALRPGRSHRLGTG